MHQLHYLSDAVLSAPRLSPGQVKPKVRAGWVWRRLQPGFGATGGAASYSRALISPDGHIAFVSDRAEGMDLLDSLPVLSIDYRLIRLAVPFADKDAAKAMGAVWVGYRKTWACAPDKAPVFTAWLPSPIEEFDLLDVNSQTPT